MLFRSAFLDTEKLFTLKGNEYSCIDLNFGTQTAATLFPLPSSVSSLFSAPSSSAAAVLPGLGVVVKRTYAPRKKSDLSLDNNGEFLLGKTTGSAVGLSSKSKDDEDDIDSKNMKNRKTDRKKEKKKVLLTAAVDAIVPPPSSTSSASSSSSSSAASGSVTFSTTAPPPPLGIFPTLPLPTLSLIAPSTITTLKDDEGSCTVERTPVMESSDTLCTYGYEEVEEEDMYESCWAADRMVQTILSLHIECQMTSNIGLRNIRFLSKQGLAMIMSQAISTEWKQQLENTNEESMAGITRPPIAVRGLSNGSGTQNPVGRPPSNPISAVSVPFNLPSAASLSDLTGSNTTIYPATVTIPNSQYIKSHGRLKLRPEFSNIPPTIPINIQTTYDREGRLNRKNFSESDKIRLRRSGVGVTDAEQLFWSLIEPFTNTPLERAKEVLKRPPGSFGGSATVPLTSSAQSSYQQPHSALTFHDTITELKRKGITVDSHVHVHPLQNAMRCDLQLVPTWESKSALTDSHTQFTIRYVIPRANSAKNSRKSRAQIVNPRGERDKEPVRKRVLDQPMLINNIRNVRPRLEAGSNSRPSSLGGTVNPLFTRLPAIRTLIKPRGQSVIQSALRNLYYFHCILFLFCTIKHCTYQLIYDIFIYLKYLHIYQFIF